MCALRDKPLRMFGAALAGLALYLQLAFAGWGMLALAAQDQADGALPVHALCLAGGGEPQPAAPSQGAPVAPAHDHIAFCCLWHSPPAITPSVIPAALPTAYARIAQSNSGDAPFLSGLHRSPANARAPPTLA